jgi:hypothetical protein
MKKKLLVSALALVLLIGVGTGAYLLYEYKEHKPLILACKLNESALDPTLVGRAYILYFWAPPYGWGSDLNDDSQTTPRYWSFEEEQWRHFEYPNSMSLRADKNQFEWLASDYELMRVDRNGGDFSISICPYSMDLMRKCVDESLEEADLIILARGSCTKSAEPAKTLKQKF